MVGRYLLPFIWNKRNASLNDSTLTQLELEANDKVLDIGCGGGYLIGKMIEQATVRHISGIDASAEIVEHCGSLFSRSIKDCYLDIQCAKVDALPYSHDHFSKACSVNSIFYWPDLLRGLREIYRVLASNGLLVLTYTSKHDLDKQGFFPDDVRSYRDEEVTGALRSEKFHDVFLKQEADKHRSYSIVTARK